jgi:HD domain
MTYSQWRSARVSDDDRGMTTHDVTTVDNSLCAPPAVPWATAALELVFAQESPSVANHSVRAWAFARLLREHLDLTGEVDDTVLFAATVLHDIGLRRDAREPIRFEIDGADRAAEFLTAQGLPAVDVDKVWDAIALHTSLGLAERRSALAMLVQAGTGADLGYFTEFITDDQGTAIHQAYPRLALGRSIVDDIVAQIIDVPERGPQFSIGAVLTQERSTAPFLSQMERDVAASRWGE